MQLSSIFAIIAFTAAGVMAAPPPVYAPPPPPPPPKPHVPTPPKYQPPPKPQPPVNNNQANTCSSGSPFCCSPSSVYGHTCASSVGVSCNTISICCNNFANQAEAIQQCGTNSLFPNGVYFPGYPQY